MKLSLLVAMAANRVIGVDNRLPWRLSADLKRFKAITWGKPILMGRKTHESIGRPLPGRTNIILTRDAAYQAAGCLTAQSLKQAQGLVPDAAELMVIGGSAVYELTLPLADRLYLTLIEREFAGDTYFPEFDDKQWREVESIPVTDDETVDFSYRFTLLERIPQAHP